MRISEMKWYFNRSEGYFFTKSEYTYEIFELQRFFKDLMMFCNLVGGIDLLIDNVSIRIESGCTCISLRDLMKSTYSTRAWRWSPISLQGIRTIDTSLRLEQPESRFDSEPSTPSLCSTCWDCQENADYKANHRAARMRKRMGSDDGEYYEKSDEIIEIEEYWDTSSERRVNFKDFCPEHPDSRKQFRFSYESSESSDEYSEESASSDKDFDSEKSNDYSYSYRPIRHFA